MWRQIAGLVVAFCLIASARADVVSEQIGGCLVVHVRGSNTSANLRDWCGRKPVIKYPNGSSFQTLYSWAPGPLATAFIEAERGVFGTQDNSREVRITLYPDSLVNAGVNIDRATASSSGIDITINSGLLDFTEAIVAGYMLDILRNTPDAQPGIGFRDWLINMPNATAGNLQSWSVKWPGTSTLPSLEWNLKYIRTPAHSVYTFVFAHELSHIALNLPSVSTPAREALARELRADRFGFDHITVAGPNRMLMATKGELQPTFIIAFLAATAAFERTRNDIIVRSGGGAAGQTVADVLPARDWIRRGAALIEGWKQVCTQQQSRAMCPTGYEKLIAEGQNMLGTASGSNEGWPH